MKTIDPDAQAEPAEPGFPQLACGKNPIRFMPEFFDKYKKLMPAVDAKFTNILLRLREDPFRAEEKVATTEGVEANTGTVFVGDSALNMKDWMLE